MAQALTSRRRKTTPDCHEQLIISLNERWAVYRKELKRCGRECKEKAVHDLRVASRRLIATVDILLTIIPSDRLRRARRSLKKLLQSLGDLRDIQVQVRAVEKLLPSYSALLGFFSVLVLREQRLVKRVAGHVKKGSDGALKRSIGDAAEKLKLLGRNPALRMATHSAILGAIRSAFAKAKARRHEVTPEDTATIHKLRVSFKKFRYMVEAVHPCLAAVTGNQLRAMNAYQTRMGDIQDVEVLIGSINEYALWRGKASEESLLPLHQELARKRNELITTFMKSADDLYGFWREEAVGSKKRRTARRQPNVLHTTSNL